MQVEFWGVRGSIACGGRKYAVYGGNTSCVSLTSQGHTLIIDAGTGLRELGERLRHEKAHQLHLFLSHTHFDHICGFPFFAPAYDPQVDLTVWSGHLDRGVDGGTRMVMGRLMEAPLFPVDPMIFRGRISYQDFDPGSVLTPFPGFRVQTSLLNHPNGAVGYRVEAGGKAVVYASDHEHGDAEADERLLALATKCDLLIFDSTFTASTYEAHRGWGHSTWEAGVEFAAAARAKSLALFHHDPSHTDPVMAMIEKRAKAAGRRHRVQVFAAREGQTWPLRRWF